MDTKRAISAVKLMLHSLVSRPNLGPQNTWSSEVNYFDVVGCIPGPCEPKKGELNEIMDFFVSSSHNTHYRFTYYEFLNNY